MLLMCFVHILYISTLTTTAVNFKVLYVINPTVNCELVELVVLVTSFRLANNRKSAQKGQKSQKIFEVLLMLSVLQTAVRI